MQGTYHDTIWSSIFCSGLLWHPGQGVAGLTDSFCIGEGQRKRTSGFLFTVEYDILIPKTESVIALASSPAVCVSNLKGMVQFQKKTLYLKILFFPIALWKSLKFHHYNSLV